MRRGSKVGRGLMQIRAILHSIVSLVKCVAATPWKLEGHLPTEIHLQIVLAKNADNCTRTLYATIKVKWSIIYWCNCLYTRAIELVNKQWILRSFQCTLLLSCQNVFVETNSDIINIISYLLFAVCTLHRVFKKKRSDAKQTFTATPINRSLDCVNIRLHIPRLPPLWKSSLANQLRRLVLMFPLGVNATIFYPITNFKSFANFITWVELEAN